MKKIVVWLAPLALLAFVSTGCGKLAKCADTSDEKVCTDKSKFEKDKECEWDPKGNDNKGACVDKK